MRLLIHAPNVHQGGGRTLLMALLNAATARHNVSAVVDARLDLPAAVPPSMIAARVSPGIGARLAAEWRLRSLAQPDDVVLCFGNLPPLFGARGRVLLFLQNRYVLGRPRMRGLPTGMRVRTELERIWLRICLRHVHVVVVQTPSMAREVHEELGVSPVVIPFAPQGPTAAPSSHGER